MAYIRLAVLLLVVVPVIHAQWSRINTRYGNIFAFDDVLFLASMSTGSNDTLYRSTDHGVTWLKTIGTLRGRTYLHGMTKIGANIYGANGGQGSNGDSTYVWVSSDQGASWTRYGKSYQPPTVSNPMALFSVNGALYIAHNQSYVYTTSDNGLTWTEVMRSKLPALSSYLINAFAANGSAWYSSVNSDLLGIWKTTNAAATPFIRTVTSVSIFGNQGVFDLATNGTTVIGGTSFGVVRTAVAASDTVMNTSNTGLPPGSFTGTSGFVQSLFYHGGAFYVNLQNTGTVSRTFRSTDEGLNWKELPTGLPTNIATTIQQFAATSTHLFCAVSSSVDTIIGTWRIPIAGLTNVNSSASSPTHFSLEQNYPNPFNPSTTISFTLQTSGFSSLKIYDMMGREAATLANEFLEAGVVHQRLFNAERLSSGIYIARLTSGSQHQIRRMMLLK